jgi:hypothetical protein
MKSGAPNLSEVATTTQRKRSVLAPKTKAAKPRPMRRPARRAK